MVQFKTQKFTFFAPRTEIFLKKLPLVPWFGTRGRYLCNRNKTHNVMRNTEYNLEKLASMISSESSFTALMEIMGDMGLEFEGAVKAV